MSPSQIKKAKTRDDLKIKNGLPPLRKCPSTFFRVRNITRLEKTGSQSKLLYFLFYTNKRVFNYKQDSNERKNQRATKSRQENAGKDRLNLPRSDKFGENEKYPSASTYCCYTADHRGRRLSFRMQL